MVILDRFVLVVGGMLWLCGRLLVLISGVVVVGSVVVSRCLCCLLVVACLLLFTLWFGVALAISGWCWFWICVVWCAVGLLFSLRSLLFCVLDVC